MNLLEETRYRLACCAADTGNGWGEALSLRNHLQGPVAKRRAQLGPFVNHIEALPENHSLRSDNSVNTLLMEYLELTQVNTLANQYLRIVEISPPKIEAKEPGRYQTSGRIVG